MKDDVKGEQQKDYFEKMKELYIDVNANFTCEFDSIGTIRLLKKPIFWCRYAVSCNNPLPSGRGLARQRPQGG